MKRLSDGVRAACNGEVKLFIQLIDFLSIRRRPEPAKFFERFLKITEHHRSAVGLTDETQVRAALAKLPPAELDKALTREELEALRFGQRERVTDTHLPHIAELPAVLPKLPTAPDNLKTAFNLDTQFWADNGDQLKERFNAWLSQ